MVCRGGFAKPGGACRTGARLCQLQCAAVASGAGRRASTSDTDPGDCDTRECQSNRSSGIRLCGDSATYGVKRWRRASGSDTDPSSCVTRCGQSNKSNGAKRGAATSTPETDPGGSVTRGMLGAGPNGARLY